MMPYILSSRLSVIWGLWMWLYLENYNDISEAAA